ncbi:MAG: glycosyltransferase family 2 protein, partial [Kiritimatiellae bacterium]|nr:glycosyltransferase family 2 protein [Kiritimatiellia bacterium]
MNSQQIWCIIPVYNNSATIKSMANSCREYIERVLVVDDGSTDIDIKSLFINSDITVISHDHNMGKGEAIKTGLDYVREHQGTHMITIDADGQHIPEDILKFITAIEKHPTDIIIGCRDFSKDNIPASSKFGRRFSNLWLRIETGRKC